MGKTPTTDRPTCPHCGSADVAGIFFGLPIFTDTLNRAVEEKRIVLGGCCTAGGAEPRWHCNNCQSRWERRDGKAGRAFDLKRAQETARRRLDEDPKFKESVRGLSRWEVIQRAQQDEQL